MKLTGYLIILSGLSWPFTLLAQDLQTMDGKALSFIQAQQLLFTQSAAIQGSAATRKAAAFETEAYSTLWQPVITIDAEKMRYQKSLDISLSNFDITGINNPGLQQIINTLQPQISGNLNFRTQRNLTRAAINAIQPIYSGGAISAAQQAAQIKAQLANAQADEKTDLERFSLISAYFGQVLAQRQLGVANANLAGFEQHLHNAKIMQRQGVIPFANVLEIEVARDTAAREQLRAHDELTTAQDNLAVILRQSMPIMTVSPLFVNRQTLPAKEQFIKTALIQQPLLKQADAGFALAQQNEQLIKASRLPKVFAFGSYSLDRSQAPLIQPDWIIGIGIGLTINSSINRNSAVHAAHLKRDAADLARQQARNDITLAVNKAYNQLITAQRQFTSLQSNIRAAKENLRVQQLAFREGEGTATRVIDARNALSTAQLQRAAAAYQYDLALAALLIASGQGAAFEQYLTRADVEEVL